MYYYKLPDQLLNRIEVLAEHLTTYVHDAAAIVDVPEFSRRSCLQARIRSAVRDYREAVERGDPELFGTIAVRRPTAKASEDGVLRY